MRADRRLLAAGAVVAVAVAIASAPRRADAGDAAPPVAAARCAPCHAAAHAAWAPSNHARSTRGLTPADLGIADGATLRVEHDGHVSTFSAARGAVTLETAGPDGKPARYEVPWVVGPRRVEMFVGPVPSGAVQVMPVMREVPTGRWFDWTHLVFGGPLVGGRAGPAPVVAPGDETWWTGPVRSFDARCARCHVSGREPVAPSPDGTGPRSRWRALGVDCEACHGDGDAHVAFWRRSRPDPAAKDPIVRWRDLDRDASLSACLACHLEGEVVARGMAPGRDVLEHVDPTLIDDPERLDAHARPMELVYEGLSLLSSRCAERGGLTCLDCHASHGSPHGALLVRPVVGDGLCARCHRAEAGAPAAHSHHAAGGAGARCVACHLPPVPVERGHGVVTDHTIGVPRVPAPGEVAARDACTGCHEGGRGFPAGAPAVVADRLRAAYAAWWPSAATRRGWPDAFLAQRQGAPHAAAALTDVLYDTSVPRVVRASAAAALGRLEATPEAPLLDAVADEDPWVRAAAASALARVRSPAADAALTAALADASPLVRARAAKAALEGWTRVSGDAALRRAALPVLRAQAEAVPDDDLRWFRLGAACELDGDAAGAVAAYARQVALDPFAGAVRERLARLRATAPPRR